MHYMDKKFTLTFDNSSNKTT